MDFTKRFYLTSWTLYFVSIVYAESTRGIPGFDYPTYTTVPKTSFKCSRQKKIPGFYADFEADCQVFHHCYRNRQKSYLCAVGTIFNQELQSCDHWYNTKCEPPPTTSPKKKQKSKFKDEPFVVPQKKPSNVFEKMAALYEQKENSTSVVDTGNEGNDISSQNFVEQAKTNLSSIPSKDAGEKDLNYSNPSNVNSKDNTNDKNVDIILSNDTISVKSDGDKSKGQLYNLPEQKSESSIEKPQSFVQPSNEKVKSSKHTTKPPSNPHTTLSGQLSDIKSKFERVFQQRSSNMESSDKKRKLRRKPTYVVLQTETDAASSTKTENTDEGVRKISYNPIYKTDEIKAESNVKNIENGDKSVSSQPKKNRKPLLKSGNDDIKKDETTDGKEIDPFIPGNIMTPFIENIELKSKPRNRKPILVKQTSHVKPGEDSNHDDPIKIPEILLEDGLVKITEQSDLINRHVPTGKPAKRQKISNQLKSTPSEQINPNLDSKEKKHIDENSSVINSEKEVVHETDPKISSSDLEWHTNSLNDVNLEESENEKETTARDLNFHDNEEYSPEEENLSQSEDYEYEWVVNPEYEKYQQYVQSKDFSHDSSNMEESQEYVYQTPDEYDPRNEWSEHYLEQEKQSPSNSNQEYRSYYDTGLLDNGMLSETNYEMVPSNEGVLSDNFKNEFEELSQINWGDNSNFGNYENIDSADTESIVKHDQNEHNKKGSEDVTKDESNSLPETIPIFLIPKNKIDPKYIIENSDDDEDTEDITKREMQKENSPISDYKTLLSELSRELPESSQNAEQLFPKNKFNKVYTNAKYNEHLSNEKAISDILIDDGVVDTDWSSKSKSNLPNEKSEHLKDQKEIADILRDDGVVDIELSPKRKSDMSMEKIEHLSDQKAISDILRDDGVVDTDWSSKSKSNMSNEKSEHLNDQKAISDILRDDGVVDINSSPKKKSDMSMEEIEHLSDQNAISDILRADGVIDVDWSPNSISEMPNKERDTVLKIDSFEKSLNSPKSNEIMSEDNAESRGNSNNRILVSEKLKSSVKESDTKQIDSEQETDIQDNQVFHPNSVALPTNDFEKNLYLKNLDSAQEKPNAMLHYSGIFPTTFFKDIDPGTQRKMIPTDFQENSQRTNLIKLKSNLLQMKKSLNSLAFSDGLKSPKSMQRSGSSKPADISPQTETSSWITNLKSLLPDFKTKSKFSSRSGKPFKKFKPPKLLRLLMFGQKLLRIKQAKLDLLKSFLPFRGDT